MTYRVTQEQLKLILDALENLPNESFIASDINKNEFVQGVKGLLITMQTTNMDYVYIIGRDINKL